MYMYMRSRPLPHDRCRHAELRLEPQRIATYTGLFPVTDMSANRQENGDGGREQTDVMSAKLYRATGRATSIDQTSLSQISPAGDSTLTAGCCLTT